MVASSVTSPLCTWLVAACMSLSSERNHLSKPPSIFQCSRKLSWSARRRKAAKQCFNDGGSWVSSFYGSGIKNWVNSCLAFQPCEEYNNSKGLVCFNGGPFSIFGSKATPATHRQRRKDRAAHSGKTMAVAVEPEKDATVKNRSLAKKRRVVVTGVGVVSSLGHDADEFYNNLLEGVSGITEIEAFDCSEFPTKIAGEIKNFSANGWVAPKLCKRADKFMLYLLMAGKKALVDGCVTEDVMGELDKAKCGILIGSALGGIKKL